MQSRSITGPAVYASVAAGPIFLLVALFAVLFSTNDPWVPEMDDWFVLPSLLISVLVGFIVGLVPILLATKGMTILARSNIGMRHPAAWALVGAATGAALGAAFDAAFLGAEASALLAATASGCALVARARTRWLE